MDLTLCKDIILIICRYFDNDRDIVCLLSVNKNLNSYKNLVVYQSFVNSDKVIKLWYPNSFTNLKIFNKISYSIKINFSLPRLENIQKLTINKYRGKIDFIAKSRITHLYLLENCRICINTLVFPDTLVHLTWKLLCQQDIPFHKFNENLSEICLFNYKYGGIQIPGTIKSLTINDCCRNIICGSDLKNLEKLYVDNYFYLGEIFFYNPLLHYLFHKIPVIELYIAGQRKILQNNILIDFEQNDHEDLN